MTTNGLTQQVETCETILLKSVLLHFVVSNLPNSSLTSAQIIHSKRQRNTSRAVLNDITNISHSLAYPNVSSSTGIHHTPNKKKQAAEDDLNEGNKNKSCR